MKLADKYTRPSLNRQTYIPNRVRTINAEAMKGLDTIYEAIAQNRKISYKYFKYSINGYNKTKEYQRADNSKIITASPYSVSWEGGKFYIYALREATEDIFEEQYAENLDEETADSIEIIKDTQLYVHCFLELEYMEQIKVLPDKREGNDIAKKQLEFESQESTGGKTKLKVSNQYISDVVSKFGHTAIITPVDEEFFIATIDEPPSPELYMWTHTLFPFAEIIYPENAENKLKSYFSKLSKGDELMLPYFLYSNQEMEKLLFT